MVTKTVKLSRPLMVSNFIRYKGKHFFFHVYSMEVVTHTNVVLPFDVVIDI